MCTQSTQNTDLFFITPIRNYDFVLIGQLPIDGVLGIDQHLMIPKRQAQFVDSI